MGKPTQTMEKGTVYVYYLIMRTNVYTEKPFAFAFFNGFKGVVRREILEVFPLFENFLRMDFIVHFQEIEFHECRSLNVLAKAHKYNTPQPPNSIGTLHTIDPPLSGL
jgi:hypothetical protein